ncbi:hypothetical protein CTAYLR_006530 [Chrysophaeum taylorii]|uniref:Uncharacterized protein n=1 Tax=Chrysophaeum taylorii TaxID=2483200 RepID=A0AAD7UFE7_9STRA|nr:hypothetical protein CTAYLR_006530 [Chrysophaeum taylorii]
MRTLETRIRLPRLQRASRVEQRLYRNLDDAAFETRLFRKRARDDEWQLRDGSVGCGGWETVGTDRENLVLADYLSYDEIAVSAVLGASAST